jgi:hypothetical protein
MKSRIRFLVLVACFAAAPALEGCSRPAYGQSTAALSASPREYRVLVVQSSLEARQPVALNARDTVVAGNAEQFTAELNRLLKTEGWVLKEMITLENSGRETWAVLWR